MGQTPKESRLSQKWTGGRYSDPAKIFHPEFHTARHPPPLDYTHPMNTAPLHMPGARVKVAENAPAHSRASTAAPAAAPGAQIRYELAEAIALMWGGLPGYSNAGFDKAFALLESIDWQGVIVSRWRMPEWPREMNGVIVEDSFTVRFSTLDGVPFALVSFPASAQLIVLEDRLEDRLEAAFQAPAAVVGPGLAPPTG